MIAGTCASFYDELTISSSVVEFEYMNKEASPMLLLFHLHIYPSMARVRWRASRVSQGRDLANFHDLPIAREERRGITLRLRGVHAALDGKISISSSFFDRIGFERLYPLE